MKNFRVIPTKYNGYFFRSRLEARWAIFFDSLGIKYFYEHEGYEIDGKWYLPDFYFIENAINVEIKPIFNQNAFLKCILLAKNSYHSTLLIIGQPYNGEYNVIFFESLSYDDKNSKFFVDQHNMIFSECAICHKACLFEPHKDDYFFIALVCNCLPSQYYPLKYSYTINKAFLKARQMRF